MIAVKPAETGVAGVAGVAETRTAESVIEEMDTVTHLGPCLPLQPTIYKASCQHAFMRIVSPNQHT
jgi:hypothetical protein